MSAAQIMDEVVQDKPYYDNSNGGMTISGGECLCQSAFVEQLIDAAHEKGIHAAIETNLSFDFAHIEDVLRKCDLVMFDIKLMDDEAHKKYTGVGNAKVLENAKKLDELGVPFIVRTPLIPGVTDTEENVSAIVDYIKDLKHLVRYELLNFNTLGGAKYESLSAANAHADARPLNKERLDELLAIIERAGITGKVG
jgi:pyruvate formate lyase activating enzyme